MLELVGLLGVLEDKGVKVALAADLELDGRGLLAALDASRAGVLAAADLDELRGMSVYLLSVFISPPWKARETAREIAQSEARRER